MVNNGRSYRAVRCNSAPQNNNVSKVLHRLMAIDLAIVETGLYLDSYPENKAALNYYKKLADERQKLVAELSRAGRPITSLDAGTNDSWDWVNSPWPWEAEANM